VDLDDDTGPGHFTLAEQIACVERELGLRKGLYPKWVQQEKLSQHKADREIACMSQVVRTLRALINDGK
jgi:hypothetical protein